MTHVKIIPQTMLPTSNLPLQFKTWLVQNLLHLSLPPKLTFNTKKNQTKSPQTPTHKRNSTSPKLGVFFLPRPEHLVSRNPAVVRDSPAGIDSAVRPTAAAAGLTSSSAGLGIVLSEKITKSIDTNN